jgi:hypothetical protein
MPHWATLPSFAVAFWSRSNDIVGFSGYFRIFPEFAANARFFRLLPPVSRYFRVFPDGFKLDIRRLSSVL